LYPLTYRVREEFLAVVDEPPRPFEFVTIAAGARVVIRGQVKESGLVDVLYQDEIVTVFVRDLETKTDVVERRMA
jgi:uncharacterized protein YraI